jgi:hypothetical protein
MDAARDADRAREVKERRESLSGLLWGSLPLVVFILGCWFLTEPLTESEVAINRYHAQHHKPYKPSRRHSEFRSSFPYEYGWFDGDEER